LNDNILMTGGGDIVKVISERFDSGAKVSNIFGSPVTSGGITIIPVGRVWQAVAGGGGGSTGDTEADGGAAGALRVLPMGFVEVSPSGARFVEFSQWRKMAAVGAIALGLGLFLGIRTGSKPL
jgi:uncharacterized spore protein YtfJ